MHFNWVDSYFTVLWWFLLYISVNWPQAYMCPLILCALLTAPHIPSLQVVISHREC